MNVQDWIPDNVWLNVIALSSVDSFRDLPEYVIKDEALWKTWYDQEAPERATLPNYEGKLSKFEQMCLVKVKCCRQSISDNPRQQNSHRHTWLSGVEISRTHRKFFMLPKDDMLTMPHRDKKHDRHLLRSMSELEIQETFYSWIGLYQASLELVKSRN